jgi:hypothetical protein
MEMFPVLGAASGIDFQSTCFRQRGYSRFRVANIKSDYEKSGSATAVELHFSLPFHIPGRQASIKAIPCG